MTTTQRNFLDAVEDSAAIRVGVKVQVWGPSGSGKSHDAYLTLPRPLIAVDSDVAAALFTDERFDGFKRLGPDKVPDLDALIAFLEEFAGDARWHREYRSLLIDSLSVYIDQLVAALGIDTASRDRETGKRQAAFGRAAKELTRLIRRVSALGVHVYVIAEERVRFDGAAPSEANAAKSSLSPTKFTHPFDLILQKVDPATVVVQKSRYPRWPKGHRETAYDAERVLTPIFAGREMRARGLDTFDPATAAHEELLELLRRLRSQSRGGVIADERMRTLIATAHDNDLPESEVRGVINALTREFVPAPAKPLPPLPSGPATRRSGS